MRFEVEFKIFLLIFNDDSKVWVNINGVWSKSKKLIEVFVIYFSFFFFLKLVDWNLKYKCIILFDSKYM